MFTVNVEERGSTGRHVISASIHNKGYAGKLCGILGNWDGDKENDMIPNGSTKPGTGTEVGNSWILGNIFQQSTYLDYTTSKVCKIMTCRCNI